MEAPRLRGSSQAPGPVRSGQGRRLPRTIVALFWGVALVVAVAGVTRAEVAPERMRLHLASFDQVRSTIEARYPHEERLDQAWVVRADSLRLEVERATSDEAVRSLLRALALTFGESHFGIIPTESYGGLYERHPSPGSVNEPKTDQGSSDMGVAPVVGSGTSAASSDSLEAEQGGPGVAGPGSDGISGEDEDKRIPSDENADVPYFEGDVGITPRWLGFEEGVVVVRIREGSPADTAGVVPGDRIVSTDGTRMDELIELALENSDSLVRPETGIAIAVQPHLSGARGTRLSLVRIDSAGDTLETLLPVADWPGVATRLGALPEQTVRTYSRDVGDAGVIGFNMFLAPGTVMPFIEKEVEAFRDKPGIILDLRGNHGGLLPMIQGIAGWFVREPSQFGRMKMRGADLKLISNPRHWTYEGRVAILADEVSVSAAELFTAGMQELGLARVFGSRTAGLALPANVIKLPNGDGFLYVVADYTTVSGVRLERTGVVPDVEVPLDRISLYEDPDPVLSAALAWIRGEIELPTVD